MRGRSVATGMFVIATCGAFGAGVAGPAAAASCSAVTISQGQGINFDVSSVVVTSGACVRFANLTDVTVTVTVSGSSFSEKLPPRTPASASSSYIAHKSATTTATDGVRTGHGSITVERADATPTTPPTSSAAVPTATGSGGGAVEPPASVVSTIGPYSLAGPAPPVQTQGAAAVLPVLPAFSPGQSSAPQTASHPVVAPRVKPSNDPQLTSTVVEPVSGTGRGLPAVVAVVLLLGLAAGYARTVLTASPAVDGRSAARPLRPTV
ncbi:MAG: hypothetical protein ACTHK4_16155 [Mycobacteriales bacterium]